MTLLAVEAAQRRVVRLVHPVTTETVPLARGLGRVLAADIRSLALPLFDNSSVDGFAVQSSAVRGASRRHPVELRVVADISAGSPSPIGINSGVAARIMTGAPMPRGADSVVMLENTDHSRASRDGSPPQMVRIYEPTAPGTNVRARGSDVRAHQVVLRAGTAMRPQELGLLSMLGRGTVRVYRRPILAILSSGDELLAPHHALRPGAIRDTNSTTLTALASGAGCDVLALGIARDSRRSIETHLKPAVKRADMIITSAGVSVGALDLVKDVVRDHGQLLFWKVNVRPGKPLAVGRYQGVPLIGLPGNPVSAFVGFELFVRPAINRLAGRKPALQQKVRAQLTEPIELDGRESYMRAIVEEREGAYTLRLTGHQGSGNLLSLVQANALLVIPAGVKSLAVGAQVEAWLI